MKPQEEFREAMVQFLENELVGPSKPDEILDESPRSRYSAGILFPGGNLIDENEDVRDDETASVVPSPADSPTGDGERDGDQERRRGGDEESADAAYDSPVQLANACFPAAMGLSFVAAPEDNTLVFEPQAAIYVRTTVPDPVPAGTPEVRDPADKPDHAAVQGKAEDAAGSKKTAPVLWQRKQLEIKPVTLKFDPARRRQLLTADLGNGLRLLVLARRRSDRSLLITASLDNRKVASRSGPAPVEDCFFQVGLSVRHLSGVAVFHEYSLANIRRGDPEERALALLYRNRKAFAVGHGVAADWGAVQNGVTDRVRTAVLPRTRVPPVEPLSEPGDQYSMFYLSGAEGAVEPNAVPVALEAIVESYHQWIDAQEQAAASLPVEHGDAAAENLRLCRQCLDRLADGITLLETDKVILDAFMLMNRVMLLQQAHYKRPRRAIQEEWSDLPQSYRPASDAIGRWRSFQLVFILMNLRSLASDGQNADDPRRVVDLIWFPTGGGKTEAYLGLSAFAILLRRLRNPDAAGCTVIMRYTLRLLTSQQFQRASAMICACEAIRRSDEGRFGRQPISIGLWVGRSLTPNKRADARDALNKWASGKGENPFQLLSCPWCGTQLDNPAASGYVQTRNPTTVRFVCPERRCPFSSRSTPLPVSVIDEDIYEQPPSLIIGTVDKFAMLAWTRESAAIFGLGPAGYPAPDLIIQDELHLISGPLGSLVGLYESIIEQLCSTRGIPPKLVASTATIRRAAQQCLHLYDRDTSIFPPSGIDISDSYFARENPAAPGRLYVGILGTAAPSFTTLSVRTIASLLQGCRCAPLPSGADEAFRDSWWTVVWYFNSIRELGQGSTLVEADIKEYIRVIARRLKLQKEAIRWIGRPVEMTSRRSAEEIPEILKRLEGNYPSRDVLDTLLASCMISVGVDVPRLGLMAVAGQPKSTSEYIQATSRVGRGKDAAGLVVTMFTSGRPRDRSHFEHFRSYHEAFYRFVEPSSVTPFSLPALDRALHALMVIAARHIEGLSAPDDFDSGDTAIESLRDWLESRCGRIDQEHTQYLLDLFDRHCRDWSDIQPSAWGGFGTVPAEVRRLMRPTGDTTQDDGELLPWATPSSLREVDVECEARVIARYGAPTTEK